MIKEDLKALDAVIDKQKFKWLYESYKLKDKLIHRL